jgi:hypothetical protein
VVDPEVLARRPAEHGLDGLRRRARAAVGIGRVDLVGQRLAGQRDLEVARDRHQRDRALGGVEADEQDRVRARLALLLAPALVGAEDHQRLRLAGLRRVDLRDRDRGAPLALDDADDLLRLQEAGGRHRARRGEHDEDGGDEAALEQPEPDPRRLLRVHARPSTAPLSERAFESTGRPATKSVSAAR